MTTQGEIFTRHATPLLIDYLQHFRAVIINGPRQSGKSTLMSQILPTVGGTLRTLDDLGERQSALTDPLAYVAQGARPTMIDEVQRGGDDLVLAVKAQTDRDTTTGQFILAGSTRFLTAPTLSESLAGRAAVIDLWPLSQGELDRERLSFIDRAFDEPQQFRKRGPLEWDRTEYLRRICAGGFPEPLRLSPGRLRDAWFAQYVTGIIERDLREMARIRETSAAERILRATAAVTSAEMNISKLASDTGFSRQTVDRYVGLLEAVFLVHRVPAFAANGLQRVIRHPKLHLADTGLAAHLLGVSTEALSSLAPASLGPLVETFVVNELLKQSTWSTTEARMSHVRERTGLEVDLVLERRNGDLIGVEIKASSSVTDRDFTHLNSLRRHLGERFVHGFVVYLGPTALPFGERLTAIPAGMLWR